MGQRISLLLFTALFAAAPLSSGREAPSVARGINALGLELYRYEAKATAGSILISPYSISSALAMTYAGADGLTKIEMHRILHFPDDPAACSAAFHALAGKLSDAAQIPAHDDRTAGTDNADIMRTSLHVANRLFVQRDYTLRQPFITDMRDSFSSSPESMDFRSEPELARKHINEWVEAETHGKIRDLLPEGQPGDSTRLVLVNALYLRAAWDQAFDPDGTKPQLFNPPNGKSAPVPTMQSQRSYGYAKHSGYSAVTLPYRDGTLQFVLIVPDRVDGLPAVEQQLSGADFTAFAHLNQRLIRLHLPKFTLAPESIDLGRALQALGLKTAFDLPRGSANFDRMAPRRTSDYLSIEKVFHKAWLALDEDGTEAAAATVLTLLSLGVDAHPPTPIEVRADRPFLFAIQHVESGACLFLGRVTDPRAN